MSTEISLHDILHKRKFDASLITTFNAYLPFYENVVLKRLYAGGCRHNILMMDQSQFSEAMNSPSLRPQQAGYDYSLVPMRAVKGGAFHPKIILLVSQKQGVLFVGSHNMTISGFGLNKEMTTRLDISNRKLKSGLAAARQAWSSLNIWMEKQKDHLPKEIYDSVAAMKNFAPWLGGRVTYDKEEPLFFGSGYSDESLWDEVAKHITGPIKRVTILGPFFDEKLRFLEVVRDQLNPEEMIVGIEPGTVNISSSAVDFAKVKFVDATSFHLRKWESYLHAKALFIEGEDSDWFIIGSANPSAPAWLNVPGSRNIEGIILHRGESAAAIARDLNFSELADLPALRREIWQEIKLAVSKRKPDHNQGETGFSLVATKTDKGILLNPKAIAVEKISKIEVLDSNFDLLTSLADMNSVIERDIIVLPDDIVPKVRFVTVSMEGGRHGLLLIHDTARIASKSVSSRQQQFKACLASLGGANPEIAQLLQSFEKIVFDEHFDISSKVLKEKSRNQNATSAGDTDPNTGLVLESLRIHLKDTKQEKKRKRMTVTGDLAQLLDYLIYQVGRGLEPVREEKDFLGRNEEEQVGQDDDEHEVEPYKILEGIELVKICNRKVRNLIKRMLQQLEKATVDDRDEHVSPLLQLIAVLSMLRELRRLDLKADWVPVIESLVPVKMRKELYEGVNKFLFGKSSRLFQKAIAEMRDEHSWDEISRLKGLLSWLACDGGYDLRSEKTKFAENSDEKRERLLDYFYLLHVAPMTASDRKAGQEAELSIRSTTRAVRLNEAENWLNKHLSWGKSVCDVLYGFQKNDVKPVHEAQAGDLAYHPYLYQSWTSIVLSVFNGNATLADLEKEQGEITFQQDRLCYLKERVVV